MRIVLRVLAAVAVVYAVLFGVVLAAMSQTPARFGAFMRYAPAPIVWGALPAKRMWLWARAGELRVGDPAPDFALPLQGSKDEVALSAFRGKKPVVLVFGSYT